MKMQHDSHRMSPRSARTARGARSTRSTRSRSERILGAAVEPLEGRALLSAGQLDSTFSGDGKVSLSTLANATLNLNAPVEPVDVAVGADGRVLVTQNVLVNGVSQSSVVRLKSDGTLDTSFGAGGRVNISNTAITRVVLLTDGHILLAGSEVIRLNNDGSFDTSFGGGDGRASAQTPLVRGIVVMPDGDINLAGLTGGAGSTSAVWELNTDGSLDTTFGSQGRRVLSFSAGASVTINPVVNGIGLDAQRNIVAALTVNPGEANGAFAVARMSSAGKLDTAFGTNGLASFAIANPALVGSVAVSGGGTIYFAGTTDLRSANSRGSLIAFSSNGKLSARVATGAGGAASAALELRVQPDGKPVVIGWRRDAGGSAGNNKVLVQRFKGVSSTNPTAPGLDSTFNGTGSIAVDYTNGGAAEQTLGVGDIGWSSRFAPDWKLVIGGTSFEGSTHQFTVTRLQTDTSVAATFGSIAGTMWDDQNADAARQSIDGPVVGSGVFLDRNNNGVFDGTDVRVLSDAQGNYKFIGLTAGTYHLAQRPGAGTRNTIPVGGNYTVTLTAGQKVTGKDFALTSRSSISGVMFEDLDGDGVRQANEAVLPGWGCFIDFNDNGVFDGPDVRALAGADGLYAFSNLAPGTYRVRQNTPSDWERTVPVTSYLVTLGTNEAVRARSFGVRALAAGAHLDANRTLVVTGSPNPDTIVVSHDVAAGGAGAVNVAINGVTQSFSALSIARIYIDGRAGGDTITESGNDATVGADGGLGILSTVLGGAGNDGINLTINDGTNDRGPSDLVDGGADDDILFSDTSGNVTLRGGSGNDSINNRPIFANAATISGDGGDDRIFYVTSAAMQISGGDGSDTLDTGTNIVLGNVAISLDGVTNDGAEGLGQSNVQADVENLRLIAHQGNLTVNGSAAGNTITASNDNTVVVNGQGGNDNLSGSGSSVTVNGGDGNDSLNGSGASVFFSGGDGVDLVDFSARTANNNIVLDGSTSGGQTGEVDRFDGTVENARGGSGNDRIVGTSAANNLTGNGGNDTITANGGSDVLRGGDGNDTFFAKDGDFDDIDGENGIDQGQTDVGDSTVNVEVVTH